MIARQWGKRTAAIATVLLLAAPIAIAQQPGAGGMSNEPGQPMPGQTSPGAPMNPGTAGAGSEQATMQAMADQEFIRKTIEDNDTQVKMSQLAEQKSPSNDVKHFGQQMVEAHTQLNTQMQTLAKQLDVSQPKGPPKKEKKEIAQLETLSGPAFDATYLNAMAMEQQQSLKDFKGEAGQSQHSSAELTAKADLPILSQHYDILQKIAQEHNVPLEAKK